VAAVGDHRLFLCGMSDLSADQGRNATAWPFNRGVAQPPQAVACLKIEGHDLVLRDTIEASVGDANHDPTYSRTIVEHSVAKDHIHVPIACIQTPKSYAALLNA
jgi:hypothetical protein